MGTFYGWGCKLGGRTLPSFDIHSFRDQRTAGFMGAVVIAIIIFVVIAAVLIFVISASPSLPDGCFYYCLASTCHKEYS